MALIETEKLSKTFSARKKSAHLTGFRRWLSRGELERIAAVKGMSFSIEAGERVAFIGPNGAGKSTTLKMLTGLLQPSGGDARVAGLQPWKHRRPLAYRIGTVFGQRSQLWLHLPVRESFDLLGRIYDMERGEYEMRRDALAERFDLAELIDRPVQSLSLGQRMRCEIAASLLHKPEILFLDEPTIGLDITARAKLRDHLKTLSHEEGLTFLLTSHDTGDIAEICDRVIVINHGVKLIDSPLEALYRDHVRAKRVTLITAEAEPEFSFEGVEITDRGPHRIELSLTRGEGQGEAALDGLVAAAAAKLSLRDIAIEDPPLEEVIKHIYDGGDAA